MSRPTPSPAASSADQSLNTQEQARYAHLMLKIDEYLDKGGPSPTEAEFVEWTDLMTKKVDIRKHSASEFGALEHSLSMPLRSVRKSRKLV